MDLLWRLARPLLFAMDPERAHERTLALAARAPALLGRALGGPAAPPVPARLLGHALRSPIGLAAGLDKNAVALPLWERLGFGFVEVGTVTPRPQPGNPRPRVFRVPSASALINAMGFPSEGAEAVARRLEDLRARGRWPGIPVGANVGKNKDTPLERAAEDYAAATRPLAPFVDYVAINVSSPNTPGLRALQEPERLAALVAATREAAGPAVPVLVKLSPDLEREALAEAVDVALQAGARGLIATNTTLSRPLPPGDYPAGGCSGRPLFPLARARIEATLAAVAGRGEVVGVGGVDSPERARELLDLGCAAVQLYTALIYEGPGLIRRLNRALAAGRA